MAKLTNVFQKEDIKRTEQRPRRNIKWIHYSKLRSSEYQYCDAKEKEEIETLADTIEAIGEVLENLLVRKSDADEYEILAGHKRCAACKLLVEERGKEEYALLPCEEKRENEARAHFMVLATNVHHDETPYERMHKLTTMKSLIENNPEDFPEVQSGRMVERLAKLCNLKRSTVGEYLSISKNLGEEAMEAFKEGTIEKSAAVTLAGMPEEAQKDALEQGITSDTGLKEYKKQNLEPSKEEILLSYEYLNVAEYDELDREIVVEKLAERYRNAGIRDKDFSFEGKAKTLCINGKIITWKRYKHLLNEYKPYYKPHILSETQPDTEKPLPGQMEIVDVEMQIREKESTDSEKGYSESVPKFGTEEPIEKDAVESMDTEHIANEEEDRVMIEEAMNHFVKASAVIQGKTYVICMMVYQETASAKYWCCYIPECMVGMNLSNSFKKFNQKLLENSIENEDLARKLYEAVWKLFQDYCN